MSSISESSSSAAQPPPSKFKKRRLQGACDICRRKKVRCDSAKMPGGKCSNCIAFNSECTHFLNAKKDGKTTNDGYVVKSGPDLVTSILSNNLTYKLPKDIEALRQVITELARYARSLEAKLEISDSRKGAKSNKTPASGDNETDMVSAIGPNLDNPISSEVEILCEQLKTSLMMEHIQRRFYGPSSTFMLVKAVIECRHLYEKIEPTAAEAKTHKRRQFWIPHYWERLSKDPTRTHFHFPDPDLLPKLINIYFTCLHPYMPLLHRRTFEENVATGLHHRDRHFAFTLLAFSGWIWFSQICFFKDSFSEAPSLYELQTCCLAVLFFQGSTSPETCWIINGMGLRYALELGLHRRRMFVSPLTIEDELWKRVFWMLLVLDIILCSVLGRPLSLRSADIDAEMPVEFQDEWINAVDGNGMTPPKSSHLTYFNKKIKLLEILAMAKQTLYAAKRPTSDDDKNGTHWEQHITATLDTALNNWIDTIPDHLRWDPARTRDVYGNQSALLYVTYNYAQILVHQPFLPGRRRLSPLTLPSLAICTNAARSCCHAIHMVSPGTLLPLPQTQYALFSSGVILLLNLWAGKEHGMVLDHEKEMRDVQKCIDALGIIEDRWLSSGRFRDTLLNLSTLYNAPLESAKPRPKRYRDKLEAGPSAFRQTNEGSNRNSFIEPSPVETVRTSDDFTASISPPDDSQQYYQAIFEALDGQCITNTSANVPFGTWQGWSTQADNDTPENLLSFKLLEFPA
ncbi:fungal-specific transcription factor domain-containing protein [Cyathus striatus]|nr:fungal-specific transcription factor domain-containing protein [Cyathus striatus]